MTTAKKTEAEQTAAEKKAAAAEQAKSIAEIDAEKKLSDTTVEQEIDAGDPYLPADFGQGPGPVSPPVTMGPATVLDIPANMPYPTGNPAEPSYAEINGLPPAANAVEEV